MASDELTQVLGFSAEGALQTLKLLDSGFQTFENRLNSAGRSFTEFNRNAGKTVAALKQINSNAKAAADQLQRLNSIRPATTAAAGGATAVAPAQLLQGQAATTAMNNLLGQTAARANTATAAVNNLGTNAATAMGRARRATSGFAVSFETLVRVVTTQVIVRALSALRNAIESSFQSSLDFTRKLSEIQTLETGSTIRELGKEVRELSESFNIPLLEAAAGHFEILQNGFTEAADKANVFSAATKFSKTAVADFDDSISLLSGILNALGEDASQAELIAAKLFRTVDQGKVTGQQLANSLGRIIPVGTALGVSLDEMLASVSAISIAGVPAAETMTQVRAAMVALIKPSDDAKRAMRELGFENANQLVQAHGLVGGFKALISTTDGSSTSIGKLFRNVRGLNAILRLTGSGTEAVAEHLDRLAKTNLSEFGDIFSARIATDAEQVQLSLQKLSNFFTIELGESLVKGLHNLIQFAGGIDTVLDALRAVIPLVSTAVVSLGAFGIAAAAVSVATKLNAFTLASHIPTLINLTQGYLGAANAARVATFATRGFQVAVTGLFAILAAQSVGEFIGNRFVSVLEEAGKKYDEQQAKIVAGRKATRDTLTNIEQALNQKTVSDFEKLIATKRALYFEDVKNAKTANDQLLADNRSILDRITGAFEEHARQRAKAAQDLGKAVIDSQKRQGDIEKNLEDRRFEFQNRRFDQVSQATRLQQRSAQLASRAADSLSKATRPEEREAGLGDFRRAQAAAEQALSIADQTGNLGLRLRAERAIEEVMQKQIVAEKQLQQLAEEERKKAEADAAKAEERVNKLNQAAQEFLKKSDFFGEGGEPLAPDQIAKQRGEAEAALRQFFDLAAEGGREIQISDLFAFDQLTRKLNSSITQAELQQLSVAPQALENLQQQIQGAVDSFEIILRLAPDHEALRGLGASEGFQAVSDQAKNTEAEVTKLNRRINEAAELQDKIAVKAGPAGKALAAEFDIGISRKFVEDAKKNGTEFGVLFDDVRQRMVAAATDANFTREQFQGLLGDVGRLENMAGFALMPKAAIGDLARATERLREIVFLRERLDTEFSDVISGEAVQRATLLQEQLQVIQTGLASTVDSSAKLAANQSRVADQTERAAIAQERMRAAQAAASGGGDEDFSTGGRVGFSRGGLARKYFEDGGQARGTDTIPAMLSPGEFVVNARSTRQFMSQLQAINAGRQPVYREEGGPVTNVSVGDINVTSDTRSGNAIGRDVAQALRRELRRNSARL